MIQIQIQGHGGHILWMTLEIYSRSHGDHTFKNKNKQQQ